MTNLPRRLFLRLAAGATTLPLLPRIALAQAYPARPTTIIVGYPPGGGIDLIARLMAQWLSERLGQPFTVENRPGPGAIAGTEVVVRAAADGYTLALASAANAISPALFDNISFEFVRDIAPVAGIARAPVVMVVAADSSTMTLADFLTHAKGSPGLVIGSTQAGTPPFMAAAMFRVATGINAQQTPYPSDAAAVADLRAGSIPAHFAGPGAVMDHVKSGELRALAVTSATRFKTLPDTPTIAETVPGFEANIWLGLGAPRNTPREIVDTLHRETTTALADAKVVDRLAELGYVPMPMASDAFGRLIVDETQKWADVVSKAGLKAK